MAAQYHGTLSDTADTTPVELELPEAEHPHEEVHLRFRGTTGDLTLLVTDDASDGVLLETSAGEAQYGWVLLSSCPRWVKAGASTAFVCEVHRR